MSKFGSEFWNERYSTQEFIYGTEPNKFFAENIEHIIPGKILLLGEGEGRNAVYAAQLGWDVQAVDFSSAAKQKAMELAETRNVKIKYDIADLNQYSPNQNEFNVVAGIFCHLNPQARKRIHKEIIKALLPGGKILMEVFEKSQLGKTSGGPQKEEMLYSIEEFKTDFKTLKIDLLELKNINLNESDKHKGEASVIRFIGTK